jgi:hypothetical protein
LVGFEERAGLDSNIVAAARKPGYVVLKQVSTDRWVQVGDVDKQPGLPARRARQQAIQDATDGKAKPGESYRVILRSEWKLAAE